MVNIIVFFQMLKLFITYIFQFISDDQFTRGIWEAVRLYSLKVPVYFYQFSYQGDLPGVTNRIYPGKHSRICANRFDFFIPRNEIRYDKL